MHGLVTISELFAGFNLINTGVVNCLIVCQNARKMLHSEEKYPKVLWGGGFLSGEPLSDHSPLGRVTLLPNSTTSAPALLDTRVFGARLGPQTKILDPPVLISRG